MTESVEWQRLADHEESEPCDAHGWRQCKRCANRVNDWDNETGRREIARLNDELRTARAEVDRLREQLQSATVLPERDASGWTAAENAEFEELYGVRAAMHLRAANDRVWEVIKELRNAAVADGRNPYEDPMAQRLSAALIGERKVADDA